MNFIEITVHGGVVQSVEGVPKGSIVRVRDYDVDPGDGDPRTYHTDADGEAYVLSEYEHATRQG